MTYPTAIAESGKQPTHSANKEKGNADYFSLPSMS